MTRQKVIRRELIPSIRTKLALTGSPQAANAKDRKTMQGFWGNDKSAETQKILLDMSLL